MSNNVIIAGILGGIIGVVVGAGSSDDDAVLERMAQRLEALEASVAGAAAQDETVAGRLNAVAGSVGALDGRLRGVEGQMGALDERMSAVNGDVAALGQTLDTSVSGLDAAVADLGGTVSGLDGTVSGVGGAVEALGGAVEALDGRIADIAGAQETLAGQLDDGLASIAATNAGTTADMEAAVAALDARAAAIAGDLDAAAGAVSEQLAAITAEREAAEREAERAAARAAAEAAEAEALEARRAEAEAAREAEVADAESLAALVGEDGLALGFGQAAMVGDARVFLSRMQGSDAVMRVAGLGDVKVGPDTGDLSLDNGCAVGLAGTAGRTAYLTVDCPEAAAEAPGEVEVAAVDPEAVPETQPAVAPEPEPETAAAPDTGPDLGPDGISLSVGQTQALGAARVFFSRVSGPDVVLLVPGEGAVSVGGNAGSASIGGCDVSLAGVMDGTAYLAATCDADAVTEMVARATGSDAAPAAPADPVTLGIGETAWIGEGRVFLSRVAGGEAVLVIPGTGQATVGPQSGTASVGGCTVRLDGIEDGRVTLAPVC